MNTMRTEAANVHTPPRRRTTPALMLTFTAAILVGCTDDPAAPIASTNGAPGYQAAANLAPQSEFDPRPSFELDVEAVGSFKPGHPVHLTFTATANRPVADGELRVTLPEVASAEESGWDVVVIPVGEDIRPHVRIRRSFAVGDQARERTTLNIPEPGYYHVVATGYRHRSDAAPDMLTDVSKRDYWLWIAEQGGKLTATFDTTLFSPGDRQQRGPRGSQRRPGRVRSGGANITCTILPGDGEVILQSGCPGNPGVGIIPPAPSATQTFRVLYNKPLEGVSHKPVPGARYLWSVTSSTGAPISNGSGFVASDGSVPLIDCQGATSERRVTIAVHTLNEKAIVHYRESPHAGSLTKLCGGHDDLQVDPEMAHIFLNAVKTFDGHRQHFPFPSTDRLELGLYDDGKTYYDHNYRSGRGELHIAKTSRMVYGEYGVMVAAHEYGHYYQDKFLFTPGDVNGLMRMNPNCPTRHPPETGTDLTCAFGEAFADWYAMIVRPGDLPDWVSKTESNWYYRNCYNHTDAVRGVVRCTVDGSIVQGAVTALLWDLTDSHMGEDHDRIQRPVTNITDAMKSCRVRVGSTWIPYTGIDHLIYCLEDRLPYSVTVRSPGTGRDTTLVLFNTRPANQYPNGHNGTRILANSRDFRRLWLVNLYSKNPEIGQAPALPSIEPAPAPIPPGDGDGGGGCTDPRNCPIIY